MTSTQPTVTPAIRASAAWTAGIADGVVVVVFVLVGRSSHDEGFSLAGTVGTAWPFLAALALGWVLTRAWRQPLRIRFTGIGIWATTVAAGLVLRMLSDQGVQVSFAIVTTIVLGLFLLGWRALTQAVLARRRS